jgi:hypothetical protein
VVLGELVDDATQVELRALYKSVHALEVMLRPYADGSGTPVKAGRFTAVAIKAEVGVLLAAVEAVYALEMPLNPLP